MGRRLGHARAFLALLEDDRGGARVALQAALGWSRRPECNIPGAFGGWLALVATLDGPDGDAAREEMGTRPGMAIPITAPSGATPTPSPWAGRAAATRRRR